ncbi:MAG: HNH endonuclease, partial [Myxococcales bacterium]
AAGLAPGRNAPEECSQDEDEKWTPMRVRLTPEQRATLDEALELARKVDGATVPKWRLVASLCQETHSCARGEFDLWAPRSAAGLVALSFYAARKAAGRWMPSGECLAAIASHFIETWNPEALKHRATLQRKILERDGGVCQVPGCSRAADHVHHIRFRSAGGSDDPRNLTSVCSVHHLQGIHRGRIRVSGTAPNQLRWELGIRSRERTSDVATEAA